MNYGLLEYVGLEIMVLVRKSCSEIFQTMHQHIVWLKMGLKNAIKSNDLDCIRYLVFKTPYLKLNEENYFKMIYLAGSKSVNVEILKYICYHFHGEEIRHQGASFSYNIQFRSIIRFLIITGQFEKVKIILKSFLLYHYPALINHGTEIAGELGNLDLLRELISCARHTPKYFEAVEFGIHGAIIGGHLRIIEYLVENELWQVTFCAINLSCKFKHFNVFLYLISRARPTLLRIDFIKTYLYSDGFFGGDLEIFKNLMSRLDIVTQDFVDQTLCAVCACGSIEIVKYLTNDACANPTFRDNKCIRVACAHGRVEIVRYLCTLTGLDPGSFQNITA